MDREQAKNYAKGQIESYLTQKGIDVSKNFHCLNPGHKDRDPSMSFDKMRNQVHCFGCGATYDIFDLMGLDYGLTQPKEKFSKAYEVLGVQIDSFLQGKTQPQSKKTQHIKKEQPHEYIAEFKRWHADINRSDYLQRRGISGEIINRFQDGYCADWKSPTSPKMKPKPVIIIPTSPSSYIARSVNPNEPKQYRFMKVGNVRLFNREALGNEQKPVFVVEGEIDAFSVIEAGGEAVALGSTSNIRLLLDACKEKTPASPLIICLDNDEAGRKAAESLKTELDKLHIPCIIKPVPIGKDPNDCLVSSRERLTDFLREAEQEAFSVAERIKDSVSDKISGYDTSGYAIHESGVYAEKSSGETTRICPIAVIPSAIMENISSGVEKIELSFYKNSHWKSVICERATAASYSRIIDLANHGLEVNSENAKAMVKYISAFTACNYNKMPHYRSVSHMGWVDDQKEFMPYHTGICFDGEENYKQLYQSIAQAGTLQDWVDFVSPLRSNIYLRMMMAASFASPLIEPLSALPFVFHLWGGSGVGKTVALSVAMSIWGNPRAGAMVRSMNQTINSMLSTAAFLNSIPFAGDELQTIKNKWSGNFDQLVMCLTEGSDRGRMNYDKVNEIKSWHCAFLFTGEEPCTKATSGGGVKNRVIEVECREKVIENGNQVMNFICDNYGHAGIKYVEYIKGKHENIRQAFQKYFSEIIQATDTTDKQAASAALMAVADALSRKLFFQNERPLTIDDLKPFLFSGKEVDASERAYSYILDTIARNHAKFTLENTGNPYGEIWGKYDDDGNCFINKTVLSELLEKAGFDFDAVKRKWTEKGYLLRNSQGKMFHYTTCFGIKSQYIKLLMPE